ncbi:RNA-directed DNA polymerase, eukaryota, reverse transcriptase zinc-binding domain protein [Tanacetum coccineum]
MDSTKEGVSGKKEVNTGRKSFVVVISESLIDSDRNLECIPTEIDENGVEVVVFDDIMVAEGNKRRMWSRYGFKDIVYCSNWVFFMKFHHEEDKIPIWVKLCNIPLEAWTVKGISAIASRIRKLLVMDVVTASKCKQGIGMVRVFGHADNSCPKREPNKPASVSCEKDNTTVQSEEYVANAYKEVDDSKFGKNVKTVYQAKSKNQVEKENTPVKNPVKSIHKNVPNDSSSDEGKSEKSKKNGRKNAGKEKSNKEEDVLEEMNDIAKSMKGNDVKGLSSSKKQKEVVNFIREEKLQVCAILGTHLKSKRIRKVYDRIYGRWNWLTNMRQSVLVKMETRNNIKLYGTFIYASNGGDVSLCVGTDTPYLPCWIRRIGCQNSILQLSSFKLQNASVPALFSLPYTNSVLKSSNVFTLLNALSSISWIESKSFNFKSLSLYPSMFFSCKMLSSFL